MPFDKLPGRINHQVDLGYRFYVPPQRPVIPWASLIVPAVDRIAQGIEYQSPYNRQKRGLEMAQVNAEMSMMPQKLDVQRQQLALEKQKLDWQKQFYGNLGANGSNLPPGYVMGASGPVYDPGKYKSALEVKAMQEEASSHSGYGSMADQFRKGVGHQPINPDEHDDDPALIDWYKAQAKGKKPWEIQYDGEDIIDDDNE